MALQARWFLFVVLLVIIGFDLVWFVQATDRLQFVNVRWRFAPDLVLCVAESL